MGETTGNPFPTTSQRSIAVADLLRAMEDLDMPRWRRMIQDAEAVEVRATEHNAAGTLYVLDPNRAEFALVPDLPMPTQPLMVLCHPQDEATARSIIHTIREQPHAD